MVFRNLAARHPVAQMRQDLDRLFTSFLGNVAESGWPVAGRSRPAVNVWEDAGAIYVELELPGVKKDQLEIAVAGGELSIKVERPDVEPSGVTYHRRERSVGSFARVLRLPVDVEPDKVEAELAGGVLTIRLPKSEAARPRKIEVVTSR